MRSIFLALVCVIPVAACSPAAQSAGFYDWAEHPPMGWNSWDCFGAAVNEEQTRANADYMAKHLKKCGWQYVVVDIQWYEPTAGGWGYRPDARLAMDDYGRLLPAPNRFPSATDGKGFKPLADYIHSKGLKFGVHLMRGIPRQAVELNTPILGTSCRAADVADKKNGCGWNGDMWGVDMSKPGAQEYLNSVYKLFAEWGVDYVKVDDLSSPYHKAEIEGIRKAIDRCGSQIVFSTSPGATPLEEGAHISANANLWRVSGDFWDNWPQLKYTFELCAKWTPYRAKGHWPDPDMLPLGAIRMPNGWTNFTEDEQRTVMTLWSIARAPLMFGGHLPKNDDFTLSLLTNEEVLAVNQHSSGNKQLFRRDNEIAWVADVPGSKDKYLAVFNLRDPKYVDETKAAFKSEVVTRRTAGHAVDVDVDISGAKKLYLVVDTGGDDFACDHADWMEPRLVGPNGDLKLTELKWASATCGWGRIGINKSVSGGEMTVDGKKVAYGIGTHSPSVIDYDLPAGYTRLKARAGLDKGGVDQGSGATVRFLVFTVDPISSADKNGLRIPVSLKELGFTGTCRIRDLWKRQDIGKFQGEFAPVIPGHGAGLYRVSGK